jgi:hypothetical protein
LAGEPPERPVGPSGVRRGAIAPPKRPVGHGDVRRGRKGVVVSDTPMPDTRTGGLSRATIEGLASSWWVFLVAGVLWILFGMVRVGLLTRRSRGGGCHRAVVWPAAGAGWGW